MDYFKTWKTWETVSASWKVAYDKTSDYVTYYLGYSNPSNPDHTQTPEDEIKDYHDIIQIDKCEDETLSKRIHQDISLYHKYCVFFSEPTYIIDNIYLGSAFNAASLDVLKEKNIKLIVNVTSEISEYYPTDFQYVRYNLYDNNQHSIEKYLEDAHKVILDHRAKEGNILIHCFMGASRSASLVIYYLMKTQKHPDGRPWTFNDALVFIKEKRAVVNPTFRFTKDLARSIACGK